MIGQTTRPIVLTILDGWGIAPPGPGNAVTQASIPNFKVFSTSYPHTQLSASGEAVGLPRGEEGNSETGHLNIGAGRIVFQDLPRINMSIADESFFEISAFKEALAHVKKYGSNLHLLGLLSAGGVHSCLEHLYSLIFLAKKENFNRVFIHIISDGRDSPPRSALTYISQLLAITEKNKVGKIVSLCGRYYAMDRDHRWERTKKAYDLLVMGKGIAVNSINDGIAKSYQAGRTDEFIEPTLIDPKGVIKENDAVIFYNFRIDRPRQLTEAFVLNNFESIIIKKRSLDPYAEKFDIISTQSTQPAGQVTTFKREKVLKNLFFVTMTEYAVNLPTKVAFPQERVNFPLSQVIAENNLRQIHISETEKESFVTYYINGQYEEPFPGEDRVIIPSPKVSTYDLKPEMSALELTDQLIKKIESDVYDFIIVNFANPDMVGHTGDIKAGIKACETVDACLGKIIRQVNSKGGTTVVTADHGNVEEMINLKTGGIDTEHSINPVPFFVVDERLKNDSRTLIKGTLADVAPTILSLINIEIPSLMTGRNLIQ